MSEYNDQNNKEEKPGENNEPVNYSPNRRNPWAAKSNGETDNGAPIPPHGANANNSESSSEDKSARLALWNQGYVDEQGRYIPDFSQKWIWAGAGFLAGILGFIVMLIVGIRRPKNVRIAMLKWAAVGFLAGLAVDLVFALMSGGSFGGGIGSPLSLFGFGSGGASAPSTGGSIF